MPINRGTLDESAEKEVPSQSKNGSQINYTPQNFKCLDKNLTTKTVLLIPAIYVTNILYDYICKICGS